ncbi:hypothetical protein ABZY16_29685 [Streptomyces sp. NPDC006553]|uniref:hypothetical protein n=1 Tax=Streptomyces sp. NPDC006553 TaxID=3157180 RepID=UPI0033B9CB89
MDDYRLPASYGLIRDFLVTQHIQAAHAEAERQARIAHVRRSWAWTGLRGLVYLVGGAAASLYLNGGITWTTAMTVGASATGFLGLLWIFWVGRIHPDHEQGPLVVTRFAAAVAHVAVLVWGWASYGATTAIPWFFIGLGVLGAVISVVQGRKFSLLW